MRRTCPGRFPITARFRRCWPSWPGSATVLRLAAYGLSEVQLRLSPTAALQPRASTAYAADFHLAAGETLAAIRQEYDAVAPGAGEAARATHRSMLRPLRPTTHGSPAGAGYPLRRVLTRLVAETARHAGHADILRESIDGGTAFEPMADAGQRPATEWTEPWQPGGR